MQVVFVEIFFVFGRFAGRIGPSVVFESFLEARLKILEFFDAGFVAVGTNIDGVEAIVFPRKILGHFQRRGGMHRDTVRTIAQLTEAVENAAERTQNPGIDIFAVIEGRHIGIPIVLVDAQCRRRSYNRRMAVDMIFLKGVNIQLWRKQVDLKKSAAVFLRHQVIIAMDEGSLDQTIATGGRGKIMKEDRLVLIIG